MIEEWLMKELIRHANETIGIAVALVSALSLQQLKSHEPTIPEAHRKAQMMNEQYRNQLRRHLDWQFGIGIVVSVCGIALLLYGILNFIRSSSPTSASITIVEGILVEAIAYLFFKPTNTLRENAQQSSQAIQEELSLYTAIQTAESIGDVQTKANTLSQISLHMTGAKTVNKTAVENEDKPS